MEGQTEMKKKKYPVHEGYVDINKLKLVDIKKFLQEIKKRRGEQMTREQLEKELDRAY